MKSTNRLAIALFILCTVEVVYIWLQILLNRLVYAFIFPTGALLTLQLILHVATLPTLALVAHGLRLLLIAPLIAMSLYLATISGDLDIFVRYICDSCQQNSPFISPSKCQIACQRSSSRNNELLTACLLPCIHSSYLIIHFLVLLWIRSCIFTDDSKV